MESVIRHGYDANLALKAPGAVAITASELSTKVDINRITKSVRGALANRYGEYEFDVVVHVVALDHTTGDETYSLDFNTYDAAGANPVTHQNRLLTVADLGKTLIFTFKTGTIQEADADAALFAVNLTLAGTTPILQYWAFVSPDPD